MGAQQSDLKHDASSSAATPGKPVDRSANRLYRFSDNNWELISANATPKFYDNNEDTGGKTSDWHLEIDGTDEVSVRVDQDLGYVCSLGERRVTFSAGGAVWALRMGTEDMYRKFVEELNDKAFYNEYGRENDEAGRVKELGEDYAGMLFNRDIANRAAEPMDTDPEVREHAEVQLTPEKLKMRQAVMQAREEEEGDDDEESTIQGIVMGANDNNYLLRGQHFDVLRNVEGGVADKGVTFTLTPMRGGGASTPNARRGAATALTPGRTPSNALTPSRVLLANCERAMNVLSIQDPHLLHHADIEAGKVVSTWSFQKEGVDIPIKDIAHETKAGQLEDRNTFLGLDNNRLCKWDLRDPTGVVQQSPIVSYTGGKDYSRGTNFNCMATSGDGYVAVGSQDGKVRLYSSKTLTKANTAIPGMGAPITAIDVTHDGKWVLATTDKYLMVVKTTFEDDKGRQCSGFTSRMGGRGAVPRLLRLKPEDTARTRGRPLAKGKFTWITEPGGTSERWVVANCGNFSVIWNFMRVKSCAAEGLSYGGLPTVMDYILTSKDEDVVDAAFLHQRWVKQGAAGGDAALVVATPHRLFNMGS